MWIGNMYSTKLNNLFKQSQILVKNLRLFVNEGVCLIYLGNNNSNEVKLDFGTNDYSAVQRELEKLFPNNKIALESILKVFKDINYYRTHYKDKMFIEVNNLKGLIQVYEDNLELGDLVKVNHDYITTEHRITGLINLTIDEIDSVNPTYKVTRVKFKTLQKELYQLECEYSTNQRPSVLYGIQVNKILKIIKEDGLWTTK